jgi:hypothetical protein
MRICNITWFACIIKDSFRLSTVTFLLLDLKDIWIIHIYCFVSSSKNVFGFTDVGSYRYLIKPKPQDYLTNFFICSLNTTIKIFVRVPATGVISKQES